MRLYLVNKIVTLLFFVPLLLEAGVTLPAPMNPPRLVNDFAGLIPDVQEQELEEQVRKFNDSTGNELAVVTVDQLGGMAVEEYAHNLAEKWGIGKDKNNNGVLLLVGFQDRKIRIEVGKGLEGALPDIICGQIIRYKISPAFKAGDYAQGIINGVREIGNATQYEFDADPNASAEQGSLLPFLLIFLLFLLFMYMMMRRNKKYYMSRRGSRGWNDDWRPPFGGYIGGGPFIGGGYDHGGGGFFDGGGGGSSFGGFGGGDFGGGGASGDW
jgi:uncharacterized protein